MLFLYINIYTPNQAHNKFPKTLDQHDLSQTLVFNNIIFNFFLYILTIYVSTNIHD